MNIPPEVARAQGHYGNKGAVHGIKGGRPRLELTDEQRKERRRKQQEAWRRRNGISPKEVLTWEERRERDRKQRDEHWNEEYRSVWGRPPGEPLTAQEFDKGQKAFRTWVRECQARRFPLNWSVDFVRKHHREKRRRQRAEWLETPDAGSPQRVAGSKTRAQPERLPWQRWVAPLPPLDEETSSVGRNQPCPCGSGRKFKKCCGR